MMLFPPPYNTLMNILSVDHLKQQRTVRTGKKGGEMWAAVSFPYIQFFCAVACIGKRNAIPSSFVGPARALYKERKYKVSHVAGAISAADAATDSVSVVVVGILVPLSPRSAKWAGKAGKRRRGGNLGYAVVQDEKECPADRPPPSLLRLLGMEWG